ncbi:10 kDa heat shock protein [Linnemannia elongata]|nr:10 kDa heat shock protein [Linnemannia elongata]KAG0071016.1 10 kDa heat shock protein [Linnemannia elongata]
MLRRVIDRSSEGQSAKLDSEHSGSGTRDRFQHNFNCSASLSSGQSKGRRASRVTKFSKTIVPMMDRVLVQRIKPQQKTASGIYIPEKAQEALNEGHVIAVGKGLVTQEGKIIPSELKEGDKVLLPPYGGSAVKVDNEELILFRESEILAKIQ